MIDDIEKAIKTLELIKNSHLIARKFEELESRIKQYTKYVGETIKFVNNKFENVNENVKKERLEIIDITKKTLLTYQELTKDLQQELQQTKKYNSQLNFLIKNNNFEEIKNRLEEYKKHINKLDGSLQTIKNDLTKDLKQIKQNLATQEELQDLQKFVKKTTKALLKLQSLEKKVEDQVGIENINKTIEILKQQIEQWVFSNFAKKKHKHEIGDIIGAIDLDGDKGDITVSGNGSTYTINNNVVTTNKLANNAVTFSKIQNINSGKILGRYDTGSGVTQEISIGSGLNLNSSGVLTSTGGLSDGDKGDITVSGGGSVFTIDNDTITTSKLADNAVTTPKLADNSVTTPKLVDNSVTTNKLVDNAVTTSKVVDNAITTNKINNNAVTFSKIQNINSPRLIGRYSTGFGVLQEITIGSRLSLTPSGVLASTGGVSQFEATVGPGGDFATLGAAVNSGKKKFLLIGDTTETGDIVLPSGFLLVGTNLLNKLNMGVYRLITTSNYNYRFENLLITHTNTATGNFCITDSVYDAIFSSVIFQNNATVNNKSTIGTTSAVIFFNRCEFYGKFQNFLQIVPDGNAFFSAQSSLFDCYIRGADNTATLQIGSLNNGYLRVLNLHIKGSFANLGVKIGGGYFTNLHAPDLPISFEIDANSYVSGLLCGDLNISKGNQKIINFKSGSMTIQNSASNSNFSNGDVVGNITINSGCNNNYFNLVRRTGTLTNNGSNNQMTTLIPLA